MRELAATAIACCRQLAQCSEEPGRTTRTFLSPPMHDVHRLLGEWMRGLGMTVHVDPVGNLRGLRAGASERRLLIASHLDTVPNAGAFDGVLGVVLGVALMEALADRRLPIAVEVIGFSEEEGVRFGMPFIGSKALCGNLQMCPDIPQAITAFGPNPADLDQARMHPNSFAYLEFHIEQGPVLENLGLPLGVVENIVGQSRLRVTFEGNANHAGTTPAHLRHDALAAAAEWIALVEIQMHRQPGLVATVGKLEVEPNAANVIPALVRLTLDVRHASDDERRSAVGVLLENGGALCARRGIHLSAEPYLDQPAVPMDQALTNTLAGAVQRAGYPLHRMSSGAGHDAMIVAGVCPAVMLFLRSPGGISHHPDESVLASDVEAALKTGLAFIEALQ
jgi:allantoate deiminase